MKKNQKNPALELSPRAKLMSKYNVGRANLLAMILITLFNVIMALVGNGSYFLFTAFVPYYVVLDGMYCCGKLSPEWYEGSMSEYIFLDSSYLVTMVAFALVILALYFVFWLLSKNQKSGWLIAALVLFGIDTVGLLYFYGLYLDILLDILFHAWILYYLISSIVAAKKLKDLPCDEEEPNEDEDYFPETVELKNGKTVNRIPANYFRGAEAVGGMLYFYNDRILFRSHAINIQTGNTTIRYADMTTTKPRKNLGIPNGLLVFTQDGTEHRFVIRHRDDIMSFIDKKLVEFKNRA